MKTLLHVVQPQLPEHKLTGKLRVLVLAFALFAGNSLFGMAPGSGKKSAGAFAAGITSINIVSSSPTNAATVQYTLSLDAAVTGVTTANFSLTTSGVTGASINSVSGSGQTYTITVNTGTGDGTIGLNLANSTGISPAISTALPFAGQSYTIDKTAPGATGLYDISSNINSQKAVIGDVITLLFSTTEAIQQPAVVTIDGHTVIPVNLGGNSYSASYTMTGADAAGRVHFTCQFSDLAGNVGPFFNDLGAGDDIEFNPSEPYASSVSFVSNNTNTAAAIIGNKVTLTFTAGGAIKTPPVAIAGHTMAVTSKGGNTYTASYVMTASDASGNVPFTALLIDASNDTTTITNTTSRQNVLFNNTPTVSITGSITGMSTVPGTASGSRQFRVSGFNISGGILVQPPTGFEVSTDNVNFSRMVTVGTGVVVPSTVVYIRLEATDLSGTYASYILVSTAGASGATLPVGSSTVASLLSTLSMSAGVLSPVFKNTVVNYTANVLNSVNSITVSARNADGVAPITVNGAAVSSGYPSASIPLVVGQNSIAVVVTSLDNTISKTYTIKVTRALSNNAGLRSIGQSVSPLSPSFSSTTTNYTISTGNATASMTVKPVTSDSTATVKVNGVTVAPGATSQAIALAEGAQTVINIVVTAQNRTTTKTYTVTVSRAPSANAALSDIQLNNGALSPAFASGTTSYTAAVPNSFSSITITPTATDAHATVTVNGTAVNSGAASGPVALAEGAQTVITTVVTAQDGTTTKTYTLTVTRAPSNNADLSALKLSNGTLSPAFAMATTGYTAGVANTVTSITVTPTTADVNATIKVNGTSLTSGTASNPIMLAEGVQTVITTTITAQDGTTTQMYTVTVTRAPSTNASLSTLGQSVGGLSPAFATGTTRYTENVSNTIATMTLKPVSSDANATIKVNGATVASGTISSPITLAVGPNTITTVVTAQDGSTTKTYTLTVTRASGGADSYGTGISVTTLNQTPTLAEDGIHVHQEISPNGDGINDFLQIDNISQYPDNKLMIMNRNGQLIYQTNGYDNTSKVFDGHSNKNGQMQLPGTYFYQLDYTINGVTRHKTGFIILKY